jgi:hypothetical protein
VASRLPVVVPLIRTLMHAGKIGAALLVMFIYLLAIDIVLRML